jgi:type III secretion protein T
MLQPMVSSHSEVLGFFTALSLTQARLMPLLMMLPFMNRTMVPRAIAFAIAAGLSLMVVPVVAKGPVPGGAMLVLLVLKEGLLGLTLGWLAALPFWMFEAVGFIVDNQRGASMAATLNPLTGNDSSPLGLLFSFAFIVYFMAAGGMPLLLGMVYDSYRIWPPFAFWPHWSEEAAALVWSQLNRLVMSGLLMAAPVLLVMFLAELGLALVSRFAPQLQVFFLAMPIKSALALFVLIVYARTLFDVGIEPVRELRTWLPRLNVLWGGAP